MKTRENGRLQQGFTLVELLMVVIILGILAMVVIPQFNRAAAESKEAALAINLRIVQTAIDAFHCREFTYPGEDLVTALTTSMNGGTGINPRITYPPLLKTFPVNSVDGSNTVTVVEKMPASPMMHDNSDPRGWIYATSNGEFRANTPGEGPSGVAYFAL